MSFDHEYSWAAWRHEIEVGLRESEWPATKPEAVLETAIQRRIRVTSGERRRWVPWTRLRRILGNPSECLEDFAEHMAESRPQPQFCPGKREVLRTTGRTDAPEPPPARIAGQVLESLLTQLKDAAK